MAVGKSTNGGLTWTHSTISGANAYLRCMALDPSHPDTVYSGGYEGSGSAIYRTMDGGMSWTKLTTTTIANYVYDLAVSPANPSVIFAASGSGIYRSTDFGASWTKMSSTINSCNDVLVDPANPNRIWVGTASQGVYQSLDGGVTWTAMNAGLGDMTVNKLALNPSIYLFAGTDGAASYRWSLAVGIEEGIAPVERPGLCVTPNPVADGATIHYTVSGSDPVSISVFDLQGRLVTEISQGTQIPGDHEFWWDATAGSGAPLQPGVYFIRLVSGREVQTGRLVISR
ncbi:MAG: T9SS type A sorting domain-containing protein [Veillonellaceae bacterium]|nr:T9SS type A sorting domain-containing protein [Veillonellaceae bacterium]